MISDQIIKKILLKEGVINAKILKEVEDQVVKEKKDLVSLLADKKIITEKKLYELAALFYKLPLATLRGQTIRKDILHLIPEPIAQTHEIIAFDIDGKNLKLAMANPDDLEILEFIRKKTNLKLQIHITSPSSLHDIIQQYHKGLQAEFKDIAEDKDNSGKELKKLAEDIPIIRIIDTLLEYAIFENASDIHIEPSEKEVMVRYRIDGILKDVMTLPKSAQAGITARIKILSNLKLDEHRQPQDGRFKIASEQYKVAFRVSIIPVFDGEKIVMRLLNETSQVLSLEQLGFQKEPYESVKLNITKPHGMILVTGPTGSGKTTTLYTVLNLLNTPKVNIATVEDPVEYRMPRINQSQINPKVGFTFASGLRSLLRQDPDIIMVGEIRDLETAEIAIHAAMTGHLVLSTLHTNSAVAALPRLQDMGIASFLIATTTNVIIAQRLVRKICSECKTTYKLEKESLLDLEKTLDINSLMATFASQGIVKSSQEKLANLKFYRGQGCKQCNNNGYKGRLGIYEVLNITPEIQTLIMKKSSSKELIEEAKKQNMLTLFEDGMIKAKNGITSIEEVLRVTKN